MIRAIASALRKALRAILPTPGKCQVCGKEIEHDKTWCQQCADEVIW